MTAASVGEGGLIEVEVVCAWPDRAWCRRLSLPAGSTLADALAASDWRTLVPDADAVERFGVFGAVAGEGHRLSDGDRVELYRGLQADPKETRRRRAAGRI